METRCNDQWECIFKMSTPTIGQFPLYFTNTGTKAVLLSFSLQRRMGPAMDGRGRGLRARGDRVRGGRRSRPADGGPQLNSEQARVEWSKAKSEVSSLERGEIPPSRSREEKMTEGGRKEEEKRSGTGEVLLLGGLRVLHVFAPSCSCSSSGSCSQLAKSIPMAVGRVTVPRIPLYP